MNPAEIKSYLEDCVILKVASFNKDTQSGVAVSSKGTVKARFFLTDRISAPWLGHIEVDEPNGPNLVGNFIAGHIYDDADGRYFFHWFWSSPLRGMINKIFVDIPRKDLILAMNAFNGANLLNKKIGAKTVTLEEAVAAKLKELNLYYSQVKAVDLLPAIKAEVDPISLAKALCRNKELLLQTSREWVDSILKAPPQVDEHRAWKRSGDQRYDCPACETTNRFDPDYLKRIVLREEPVQRIAKCQKCGLESFFIFRSKDEKSEEDHKPEVHARVIAKAQLPAKPAKKDEPTWEQKQAWAERFSRITTTGVA